MAYNGVEKLCIFNFLLSFLHAQAAFSGGDSSVLYVLFPIFVFP